MAAKPKGGGLKALVAGPLRKELFSCVFPNPTMPNVQGTANFDDGKPQKKVFFDPIQKRYFAAFLTQAKGIFSLKIQSSSTA